MERIDGRKPSELRRMTIQRNYQKDPYGSVLISMGETKVICSATVEDRVPPWLRGHGQGWITASYSMLPGSTHERQAREAARGKVGGRTQEIQRLIGRSMRAVVDMAAIGERTIWIDCDVIQADGGTRTTAITGAFVALVDALHRLQQENDWDKLPITQWLAATSVGIVDDELLLDLCYEEDVRAQVDMNVVMTGNEGIVEIQGTAEGAPFTKEQHEALYALAAHGIQLLIEEQKHALGSISSQIGGAASCGVSS